MATAQLALATAKAIEANKTTKISGICLPAGATVGVHEISGALSFVLMGTTQDLTTKEIAAVAQGTDSASSLLTLYTVPAGTLAFLALMVNNAGGTAGTFSVEVTAEEVVGGGGGA